MTIEEIKELLQIFIASGVDEFELQRGENRLRLRRAGTTQELVVGTAAPPAPVVAAPAPSAPVAAPVAQPVAESPALPGDEDGALIKVRSPIVGTFYEAPSPDADPFVKVGDQVSPGQPLCIIEAMKMLNEIEADVSGIVVSKKVKNAQAVDYNQVLFEIRPL
jgi:acetyl-CoA carboxylase biotin carboxyl carrier protein